MPKRDLGSIWELLADLWTGLSPVMRGFGFGGMALGAGLGLWVLGQASGGGRLGAGRLLWWVAIACAVAGTVLGLALGALAERLGKRR